MFDRSFYISHELTILYEQFLDKPNRAKIRLPPSPRPDVNLKAETW